MVLFSITGNNTVDYLIYGFGLLAVSICGPACVGLSCLGVNILCGQRRPSTPPDSSNNGEESDSDEEATLRPLLG